MRSRRTCCRRKVCPFWLARPPSERFCSDRSRTSGHCTSKGRLGSKLGFVGDALVPASHYIHPEFGFFCPIPRFHRRLRGALACLVVAGVGAAVMATADGPKLAAAVTRADEASIAAETTPATSLAPFAAVVPRLPIVAGAQTSRPASATPGPKATVFPSSCASHAWFGWRTIAQQSLPLLSAAASLQQRAASMRRFSQPAPAPLQLATASSDVYVKEALTELASDFKAMAEDLEQRNGR